MAKNANAPAANGNEQQAPLGFLAQLSTLATAITDLSTVAVKKDPVINARTKFATNCDETIKLIKAAAESAKFFRKLPDGYLITFRNGNSAMQLNSAAHFKVADATAAIALVEAAKTAAAAGELDAAFRESTRAPTQRKNRSSATSVSGYGYFLACDSKESQTHQEWCNKYCEEDSLAYCDVWQLDCFYPRAFVGRADAALFILHFDARTIDDD